MEAEAQHVMVMAKEFEDGAQEWACPTCGRRFIMQLIPRFKRIVLVAGNEEIFHAGGSNGLNIGTATVERAHEELHPAESLDLPLDAQNDADPYLSPFSSWFEDQDL